MLSKPSASEQRNLSKVSIRKARSHIWLVLAIRTNLTKTLRTLLHRCRVTTGFIPEERTGSVVLSSYFVAVNLTLQHSV